MTGCGHVEKVMGRSMPEQLKPAVAAQELGRLDEAAKLYSSAGKENCTSPDVVMGAFQSLEKIDPPAAERMLKEVIEKLPKDNRTTRPMAMVNLSVLCLNSGRIEEAVRLNREALKLRPNDTMTINNLAYSLSLLPSPTPAQMKEALDYASSAVKAARKDASSSMTVGLYLDSLGWVYFRLGRYQDALSALQEANSLVPGNDEISYHVARTYEALKRNVDAYMEMRRAVQIAPKKTAWLKALQEIRAKLTPDEVEQLKSNLTNPDY